MSMPADRVEAAEAEIRERQKEVSYQIREYPIEVLVEKHTQKQTEGKNDLFVPDYQRDLVWDDRRQSLFIESLLIGLPIPYLFVADVGGESEEFAGRLEIIDGTQRVRTLARFVGNDLMLEGLEKRRRRLGVKNRAGMRIKRHDRGRRSGLLGTIGGMIKSFGDVGSAETSNKAAGLAGAVSAPVIGIVAPNQFAVLPSILMIVWVAVGGRGTIYGPLAGALAVSWLRTRVSETRPEDWEYFQGLLFVIVVALVPGGAQIDSPAYDLAIADLATHGISACSTLLREMQGRAASSQ